MDAVNRDKDWPLVPLAEKEVEGDPTCHNAEQVVWREWPTSEGYVTRDDGLVARKVYGRIRRRALWDMIMSRRTTTPSRASSLIDRVNEMNNNWWCGEHPRHQPLRRTAVAPPRRPLLVRSTSPFVRKPFTDAPCVDWETTGQVVRVFTRACSTTWSSERLPLQQQRDVRSRASAATAWASSPGLAAAPRPCCG